MTPPKQASSDMSSAARPRTETTRLSALATGLRWRTTAAPKTSINDAKSENWNGGMINYGLRKERRPKNRQLTTRSLFFVPFQHHAVHNTADLKEFLLVMHHIRARKSSDRVIFAQKNRLLGTNLFAHAAKNAADHVDIEFFWIFFDFGKLIS